MSKKNIHIIAGPTASGKSALAVRRALERGGAIVNCDSRQIYSELPILCAQPTKDEQKLVPHHLYGTMHPDDNCSAGTWREMAIPVIEELLEKKIIPIVTGGNGLYIKTLIEGISPIPDVPDDIRKMAVDYQARIGNPAFHAELAKRDPETASQYHPMHTARLIHAWEIFEATGKPLAYWQKQPKAAPPEDWQFDITLVMPERETLYKRCNDRFERMLEDGAAEELEEFDKKVERGEISKDSVLIKTVGANGLRAWRDGRISREDAVNLAQTETRQYAKRQTTWFNNQVKPQKNIAKIETVA
ncbi:MAG: tRNA (adenosine(37)-N6)-dimethylallyltransferase MiaA [Micavibrio aeruginosavorus]|uniref:tRNA dimethylallyltransferase n=1 Tax=Micavibrio aeruginosavorus TaxID=349221 RepID=A0A2W5MUC7_9BACT|nr:MAG: tRNA (adenosine(37)-N6)-dimethylallyltransferase MiaA [Micavibrio aeruginosavorus]